MRRGLSALALLPALLLLGQAAPEDPLRPYAGPSEPGVDRSTLAGKLLCGYQGWFGAPSDGAGRGWSHWAKDRAKPFAPGNAKVDLWPDLSEHAPEERFATGFSLPDGRPAEVFSSSRPATVLRHFRWMRDYGIDGAFAQRFIADFRDPREAAHFDRVLAACREGAHRSGRGYAVMYDLTGLGAGRIQEAMDDWAALRRRMRPAQDAAYLRHRGRPVVGVWGVGFNDGRKYTLEECRRLIEFLKGPGEASVVLGVPTGWRDSSRDAARDPALRDVLRLADVLSPWTVGRYRTPEEAAAHGDRVWKPDLEWCRAAGLDYLPVAFPGFSWHHLHGGPLDEIPRLKGRFLWSQFLAARRAGASMVYVAMFDEVDEATALFKCANDPPAGFLTYEGLPSDFYLKLAGSGARLLRGEIPPTDALPR